MSETVVERIGSNSQSFRRIRWFRLIGLESIF